MSAAPSVPRPGESLPAGAPSLSAAPLPPPAPRPGRRRRVRSALRASLHASYAEGATAELFGACAGGAVLTAWALHLGATPVVIGLLAALPLASQVLQLPGAWVTLIFGARPVAIAAIGASRLVWLPMVALPFLALPAGADLRLFVAVVAAGALLGVLGNNAWTVWMGDLVPGSLRARFFSLRTVYITLAGTAASLAAGVALDALTPRGWKAHTLAGLAAVACVAGVASVVLLRRQSAPEPPASGGRLDWRSLIQALGDRRHRSFLGYLVAWNAAVALAAGFFSFHMLGNLHTGLVLAAGHGIAVALVRIAGAPLWGRAVDRFGARPVLTLCSLGIALVPAIWLLPTPAFLWPLALEAPLAGALWGGHNIATMDLTVRLSPRLERPVYVGLFAAASGLGFAAASAAAGLFATRLPEQFVLLGATWSNLHVLFLLSALARAAASLPALRIEEPRAWRLREVLAALAGRRPPRARRTGDLVSSHRANLSPRG